VRASARLALAMSRGPRAAAPVGFLLLLALVLNNRGCDGAAPAETVEDGGGSEAPDYGAALSNSLLYFEAQRSGRLPHNQLVLWRGHSGLTDGLQQGVELVGGYYDAGDHVKFGLPMAFTVTMLAWGAVDFAADVQAAGEWGHTLQAIKWGTDYFVKAHTEPFVSWAEVRTDESRLPVVVETGGHGRNAAIHSPISISKMRFTAAAGTHNN
jgi:hypothetical protein